MVLEILLCLVSTSFNSLTGLNERLCVPVQCCLDLYTSNCIFSMVALLPLKGAKVNFSDISVFHRSSFDEKTGWFYKLLQCHVA